MLARVLPFWSTWSGRFWIACREWEKKFFPYGGRASGLSFVFLGGCGKLRYFAKNEEKLNLALESGKIFFRLLALTV